MLEHIVIGFVSLTVGLIIGYIAGCIKSDQPIIRLSDKMNDSGDPR